MLVVRVEIWPFGDRRHAKEIGRACIWNDGSGDVSHGNYGVAIMPPDELECPPVAAAMLRQATHKGYVQEYPRGPKNLWPLVRDALRAVKLRKVKSENKSHGAPAHA